MFSRWEISRAIAKRVCKFLLKKKLGEVILGDIDLEQLDVQLGAGTVQLSDLALNVEFFNQKLAGASIMVKEGSVKSLSIKVPWNLRNCEIEVNELELVLGPFVGNSTPVEDGECAVASSMGERERDPEHEKSGLESSQECSGVVAQDVHEGVKTVAKIVKWFLTSFHVRLSKLIVAFDHPNSNLAEAGMSSHKSLVLRIKETEFGTCVSEDSTIKLTNFIKFQEANIEFLQMNDIDVDDNGTSFSERNLGHSTIPVLTGESGGFSGTVNLSIPWKNGLLDICKVDADVSIEPLELRVQPSTIEWLITVWQCLQVVNRGQHIQTPNAADSFSSNSRFHSRSSLVGSRLVAADLDSSVKGNESDKLNHSISQDTPDVLLSRANVIHNWVPEFFYQDDQVVDLSASVDQFFECFDGLRSFQANSGSSGIWNWTCSVFNAITVASNLASGLGEVPKEQNVETVLRASISKISIFLSLDADPEKTVERSDYSVNQLSGGSCFETYTSCYSSMDADDPKATEVNAPKQKIHHLEAAFCNVVLDLRTYPQNMALSMSIERVEVDELYDPGNMANVYSSLNHSSETNGHILFSHYLQEKVQGSLPAFPFSIRHCGPNSLVKDHDGNDLIQVRSLESFGECHSRCNINSKESDNKSMASTSFTVHLPPFILWLNFDLVDMLLALLKQVECSLEKSHVTKCGFDFGAKGNRTSLNHVSKTEASTTGTTSYSSSRLEGLVALQQSRLIIWFPHTNYGFPKTSAILDQFIVLELTSPLSSGEVPNVPKLPRAAPARAISSSLPISIHLVMRSLDVYLVESAGDMLDAKVCTSSVALNAVKIFSAAVTNNHLSSGVTMIWQSGPVTGTWMADRAWSLSQLHGPKSRNNIVGKGTEFSSVTTLKDHEEASTNIRQELILSSAFLLHIKLHCAWINLEKCHYKTLDHLLHHVMVRFPKPADKSDKDRGVVQRKSATQISFLLDCDVLDVSISLDELVKVSQLIQKELPGSWNGFKLHIERLEVLSVSNIGGISDANLFWLKHGEGELWGSVVNERKTSQEQDDHLLIICRDSAMRRGNGEGANVLTFGPAGTAVTYLHNPILKQNYTSITIYCGTIIAPGGRMDWITSLCFYFSLPLSERDHSHCDDSESKFSDLHPDSEASFLLDLVDVALCYEPHVNQFSSGGMDSDCSVTSNEDKDKQTISFLLAASSLSLSNHSMTGTTIEYNIHLKDVGLLITNSNSLTSYRGGYDLSHLQQSGYVKVAEISFLEVVVKVRDLLWELEWSNSHINIESCHDTTYGLIRLIDQLQQLYAPDVKDSLVHLQSRWNAIREAHKDYSDNVVHDVHMNTTVQSSSENLSTVGENYRTVGLLDEILENAFEQKHPSFTSIQSHDLFDDSKPGDEHNVESTQAANRFAVSPTKSSNRAAATMLSSSENETCAPKIIESYCTPDMVGAMSPLDKQPSSEDNTYSLCTIPSKESEYVRGGWYKNDGLVIVEDHILTSLSQRDIKHQKKEHELVSDNYEVTDCCKPKGMVVLRNIDISWSMYGGNDWPTRKEIPVSSLTSSGRDACTYLELALVGLDLRHSIFPEEKVNVSKLSISVQNLHLYDRSRDAPWRTVLSNFHPKDRPRESSAKALKLELEAVRPDPSIPLEDYRLNVEFLPLRLHLDQTQLNFLVRFFGKDSLDDEFPCSPRDSDGSEVTNATTRRFGNQTIVEEALLPFFQKCDVKPVVVRVDYIPRNFDASALRRGNYAEILNLVHWKGINLQLKHICTVGIYGWSSLCETVGGLWLEDIASNQVHKLLKGLPPIRSLVAVGSGASKLVSLPVREYKKDHRLLKGMQRGAIAFIKSISIEAVGLGVHLAAGAHEILLQTEYILSNIPSSVPLSDTKRRKASIRSNQPEDAHEGIQQAYESLSDGLGRTASALIGSPLKTYQRAGAGSAVATAIKGAPAAAIAPISASARAVHYALVGFRNSLDPERKKESHEKYHGPSGS